MDSIYICPDCGQEYDEPGLCDSCQVELIEEGASEDEPGFDEEGVLGEEKEDKAGPSFSMGGGFDDEDEV